MLSWKGRSSRDYSCKSKIKIYSFSLLPPFSFNYPALIMHTVPLLVRAPDLESSSRDIRTIRVQHVYWNRGDYEN